jgi:hypothetical protein
LQGIWTDETDTLLQRSAKYADQEFFTETQRAELDRERSEVLGRDKRGERGTELDLAGAYNSAFVSWKRVGVRTSLIVDPPNGRIPPLTPEAQKIAAAEREYRLALLQATEACKSKAPICSGGKYDPTPSPRRAELPPRFSTGGMNRSDGPEDSSLAERCLTGGLPDFGVGIGSFRRIVQTPGGITIFYDVGQGQGWQRNIVMNGSTHLPANIRQWYGDSRGHWEGNTLVVETTNFLDDTTSIGRNGGNAVATSDALRLVERFTRADPDTMSYELTVNDPKIFTGPWKIAFPITQEPGYELFEYTCHERNYSMTNMLSGPRAQEKAEAAKQK